MKDLLLTRNNDLYVAPATGDVSITDSVKQAIKIRLLWFYKEWRLGPDKGMPYREEILIKNPSKFRIHTLFREAITSVDEIERLDDLQADISPKRVLTVRYRATTTWGEEIIEEVSMNA